MSYEHSPEESVPDPSIPIELVPVSPEMEFTQPETVIDKNEDFIRNAHIAKAEADLATIYNRYSEKDYRDRNPDLYPSEITAETHARMQLENLKNDTLYSSSIDRTKDGFFEQNRVDRTKLGVSDIESYRENFSPEQLEKIGRLRDAAGEMLQELEIVYRTKAPTAEMTIDDASKKMHSWASDDDRIKAMELLKSLAYGVDIELTKKPFLRTPKAYSFRQGGTKGFDWDWTERRPSTVRELERRSGVKIEEIFNYSEGE